ncbi:NADH kinase pos5, partial [Actinomortierella ambigua]
LEDADLLVLDDCHLARGNHPYKLIMTEFYHTIRSSHRPRILGTTTSPPHSPSAASQLSATLDACFLVLDLPSVMGVESIESIVTYSARSVKSAQRVLALTQKLCRNVEPFEPMFRAFSYILAQLGTWAAYQTWLHLLMIRACKTESRPDLSIMKAFSLDAAEERQSIASLRLDFSSISDKVKCLILLIKDALTYTSPGAFRGVILVERRLEAYILRSLLQQAAQLDEFGLCGLSASLLLGLAARDIDGLDMNPDEQQTMLRSFSLGLCNLLVTTPAVYEALNPPNCNLVVRFNAPSNFADYLRSRRLARSNNAMHIILQSFEQKNKLSVFQRQAIKMKEWCMQHRPESFSNHCQMSDGGSRFQTIDTLEFAGLDFVVPVTGARLTLHNATTILRTYCASMSTGKESADFSFSTLPGAEGYIASVSLPHSLGLGTPVSSSPMLSKRLAKKSAALEVCKALYDHGYLDDDLLPSQVNRHAVVGIALPPTLPKPSRASEEPWHDLENDVPSFWTSNSLSATGVHLFYMTVFTLREGNEHRNHRQIAILTRARFGCTQAIDVYFDGRPTAIDVLSMRHPVQIDSTELRVIHEFYARMSSHIHRKPVDIGSLEGAWYTFVPLIKDLRLFNSFAHGSELRAWIDWSEIRAVASADMDVAVDDVPYHILASKAGDMAIFERSMRTRVYYTKAIYRDEKEYMCLRQQLQDEIQSLNSVHLLLLDPMPEHCHHAIIAVESSMLVDNHLQTDTKPKRVVKRDRKHLLSDQCCLVPVSAAVSRAFHLVPSILIRLDAFALADSFRGTLQIPQALKDRLTLPILLEALTASAAGMSMDYQRLEMLGDTFLKFVTTTDFYIRCPMSDEGMLTAMRRDAIQNKTLFDHAMAVGLFRYATTFPLQTYHFEQSLYRHVPSDQVCKSSMVSASVITSPLLPPPPRNAKLPRPKTPIKTSKHISFRLIADMVESVIGAAYVSGGLDLGLHMARHFGHPVSSEVQRWGDFANLWDARVEAIKRDLASSVPQIKRLHPLSLTAIMPHEIMNEALDPIHHETLERVIGYRFHDRRNLVEAMADASLAKGYTYERLEFLGDAVLDMMTVQYWFQRCPCANEGVLSVMKTESVNSQTLGAVSLMMGLHRHLQHMNASLLAEWHASMVQLTDALNLRDLDVDDFAACDDPHLPPLLAHGGTLSDYNMSFDDYLPYLRRRARVEQDHEWPPFWTSMKVPKTTGDLYEALIGAVYQDARFTYEAPRAVFDKTLLVVIELFLSPTTHQRHPIKALIEGLQRLGCSKGTIHTVGGGSHSQPKKTIEKKLASRRGSSSRETLSLSLPFIECMVPLGQSTSPTYSDRSLSSVSSSDDYERENIHQQHHGRSDSEPEASGEMEPRVMKRLRLSPSRGGGSTSHGADSSSLISPPPTPTVPGSRRRHRTAEFVLHDHVILRATDVVLSEARKAAARRGHELVVEQHPELLEGICNCPLRAKLKQKAANKQARQQQKVLAIRSLSASLSPAGNRVYSTTTTAGGRGEGTGSESDSQKCHGLRTTSELPTRVKMILRTPGIYAKDPAAQHISVPSREIRHSFGNTYGGNYQLQWETDPRTVLIIKKPNDEKTDQALCDVATWIHEKYPHMNVVVEPDVAKAFADKLPFAHVIPDGKRDEYTRVTDLAITLGGDGTILHTSSLFNSAVPPVISFSMDINSYQSALEKLFKTNTASLLLRMRLKCTLHGVDGRRLQAKDGSGRINDLTVMNEVNMHRGRYPHLTSIGCYVDGSMITEAVADGLIVASPTGSTAYSLSAGGSIVHPSIQTLLLTPICPRSLSFRPVLLPPNATIQLKIGEKSRGPAEVSLDGKETYFLEKGEFLQVCMSAFPMPCVNRVHAGEDWIKDINDLLKWNQGFHNKSTMSHYFISE